MWPRIIRHGQCRLGYFQTIVTHGFEQRVDGSRIHQNVIIRKKEIVIPFLQFRMSGKILVNHFQFISLQVTDMFRIVPELFH